MEKVETELIHAITTKFEVDFPGENGGATSG